MNLQLCLIYRDLLRLDECPYYLMLLLTGLWLALIGLRSRSVAPRHYWLIYVKIYLGSFASAEWPVPICSAAGQIRRFKWTWKPSRTPTRIYFIFLFFIHVRRRRGRGRGRGRRWECESGKVGLKWCGERELQLCDVTDKVNIETQKMLAFYVLLSGNSFTYLAK